MYDSISVVFACFSGSEPRNLIVCEDSDNNIEGPHGLRIEITHANYGRTASDVCEHSDASDTSCTGDTHTQRLREECNGKTSCSVRATNSFWGDTCYGTYKYLDVDYTCGMCGMLMVVSVFVRILALPSTLRRYDFRES